MTAPIAPDRAYHHGDLRQALLSTALKLVAAQGAEAFSLREAAREVGVSPAAAYRHFADKPALLAALASEGHGLLAVAMENAAARVPADAPAPARAVGRFLAIGEGYVEFAVKNPAFFRVMFGPALKAKEFDPCCAPSGHDAYDILSATLDELVESGAIPAARRPGAEISTWAAVHGLATLLVDGALPLTPRERADSLRMVARNILLGLGYAGALLPRVPALWRDPRPVHERRHERVALAAPRGGRRR